VRGAVISAAILLLASVSLSAHRLDEYLQAARVNLTHSTVELEIDLSPGATVAETVISLVDADRDNEITAVEAESYGRAVLGDILVELDRSTVVLTLTRVEIPSLDAIRHGMGTIQIRAAGGLERSVNERSQLHFRNNHQPRSSVYLVNALMPSENGISVGAQTRDATQRDVRIEYAVRPQWPIWLYWPIVGVIALLLFVFPSSFFMTRARIIPGCARFAGE
jgi:hypothetical protein